MNNLQQLSGQRLRVQCSLAWLRGVCIDTDKLLDAPFLVCGGVLPRNICVVSGIHDDVWLLDIHVSVQLSGGLKPEVIGLLTNTAYYFQVYCAIFPSESLQTGSSDDEDNHPTCTFWPLIHGLARHGIYAVEEGGCTVNHAALAQRNPFREVIMNCLQNIHVHFCIHQCQSVSSVQSSGYSWCFNDSICSVSGDHTTCSESSQVWVTFIAVLVMCNYKRQRQHKSNLKSSFSELHVHWVGFECTSTHDKWCTCTVHVHTISYCIGIYLLPVTSTLIDKSLHWMLHMNCHLPWRKLYCCGFAKLQRLLHVLTSKRRHWCCRYM